MIVFSPFVRQIEAHMTESCSMSDLLAMNLVVTAAALRQGAMTNRGYSAMGSLPLGGFLILTGPFEGVEAPCGELKQHRNP
jgi:hypothetical protein